jgi:hypothetical protein
MGQRAFLPAHGRNLRSPDKTQTINFIGALRSMNMGNIPSPWRYEMGRPQKRAPTRRPGSRRRRAAPRHVVAQSVRHASDRTPRLRMLPSDHRRAGALIADVAVFSYQIVPQRLIITLWPARCTEVQRAGRGRPEKDRPRGQTGPLGVGGPWGPSLRRWSYGACGPSNTLVVNACCTGRSPGFSPLRIRPVYMPARRPVSVTLPP